LSINKNKQELISFLGEFVSKFVNADNLLPVGQTLYLAGTKIASDQVTDCVDLFSIQEEADARIILHALHADEQFGKSSVQGRIIIKSSDSDVLVLCVHYYPRMQNTDQLWLLMGSVTSIKDGRRYIPVHDLCSSLSSITCEILPAVHALTGCDTTSAIFGIGKKSTEPIKSHS
jgi:hypothetical protein